MFSRKKTKITMKIRGEDETLVWPHGGNIWLGSVVVIIIIIIKDISYSPVDGETNRGYRLWFINLNRLQFSGNMTYL